MVNPINNSAVSSLLRAQSVGVANLKPNQPASQAIIDQLQKTPTASAKNISNLAKVDNPSRNLPRGSLVDVLA